MIGHENGGARYQSGERAAMLCLIREMTRKGNACGVAARPDSLLEQ